MPLMTLSKVLMDAAITFTITLVVGALVTFLWGLIRHGVGAVDWETSLRLAVILGIVLPWLHARERKASKWGEVKREYRRRSGPS